MHLDWQYFLFIQWPFPEHNDVLALGWRQKVGGHWPHSWGSSVSPESSTCLFSDISWQTLYEFTNMQFVCLFVFFNYRYVCLCHVLPWRPQFLTGHWWYHSHLQLVCRWRWPGRDTWTNTTHFEARSSMSSLPALLFPLPYCSQPASQWQSWSQVWGIHSVALPSVKKCLPTNQLKVIHCSTQLKP